MAFITKAATATFSLVKKLAVALLLSVLFVALAWSVEKIGFSMKIVVPLIIVMLGVYILDQFMAERKLKRVEAPTEEEELDEETKELTGSTLTTEKE